MRISSQEAIDYQSNTATARGRDAQLHQWKMRLALQEQRKQLQKRLFGDHYNHSKVGLNKERKYLLEEQKNTEIERANLILLTKIQKIAKRSALGDIKKRVFTQMPERDSSEKSKTKDSRIVNRSHESNGANFEEESNRSNIGDYRTSKLLRKTIVKGVVEADG
jgi:hypothetical protein